MVRRIYFFMMSFVVLSMAYAANIPPIPENFQFTADQAKLFDQKTIQEIADIQRAVFELYKAPIIVVTVNSMAQYGGNGSIEDFAKEWFDHWGIGTPEKNIGILLLISVGDRKARIELGADWGQGWDGYCQQIMNTQIVPKFKYENYGLGALQGVRALGMMAKIGPQGAIPEAGLLEKAQQTWNTDKPISRLSPVPGKYVILLTGAGMLCFILAIFLPQYRKTLLLLGISLITLAFVMWVVLGIIALILRIKRGSSFGSGGGFGGGFSGGGGATGSW